LVTEQCGFCIESEIGNDKPEMLHVLHANCGMSEMFTEMETFIERYSKIGRYFKTCNCCSPQLQLIDLIETRS